jgi:hypothetical protein
LLLSVLPALSSGAAGDSQTLAEAALREAERRQKLDQQGVLAKRIEATDPGLLAPGGAISTFSPGPGLALPLPTAATQKTEPRASLRSFQTRLQKLDRDIRQTEERIKLLRARADAERWTSIKTGKGSRGSAISSAAEQLRWQISELELKLADWRRERSDVFQAGRKAGYLPGELDGRGTLR